MQRACRAQTPLINICSSGPQWPTRKVATPTTTSTTSGTLERTPLSRPQKLLCRAMLTASGHITQGGRHATCTTLSRRMVPARLSCNMVGHLLHAFQQCNRLAASCHIQAAGSCKWIQPVQSGYMSVDCDLGFYLPLSQTRNVATAATDKHSHAEQTSKHTHSSSRTSGVCEGQWSQGESQAATQPPHTTPPATCVTRCASGVSCHPLVVKPTNILATTATTM